MTTIQTENVKTAIYRLKAASVVHISWSRPGASRLESFQGCVQQVGMVDNGHDVEFLLIHGPDYQPIRLKLSQCVVCPIGADGLAARDYQWTVSSLRQIERRLSNVDLDTEFASLLG